MTKPTAHRVTRKRRSRPTTTRAGKVLKPATPLENLPKVVQQLISVRHRHSLTQEQIADILGTTSTTISRWECEQHPIQQPRILSLALRWVDYEFTNAHEVTMAAESGTATPADPVQEG